MIKKLFEKPELKFIAIFLITSVLSCLLIFSLAIIVDPHNDFGTGLFRPLVMTNRTEKLKALSEISPKPQILIFGSSRAYSMDPDLIEKITKKSAYNASVSYARPEDHWAMANHIVNDLKIKPEMLIVGLNLGEFNNDDIEPQTINNKNLIKYLDASSFIKLKSIYRGLKDSMNQKYIRDIFVSVFQLNIKPNRTGLQTQDFLPNGKIVTSANYFNEDQKQTDFSEDHRAHDLFKDMAKINLARKSYLKNLISFCNQNDIKIKIALLPMPPQILEKLYKETNYPDLYQEFLKYTDELHLAYEFIFFDFSSVDKFGGLPYDFSDATHPGAQNIDIITKLILTNTNKTKK